MGSISPTNKVVSTSVTKAVADLFAHAEAAGVTVIDVRSEAERIRSTIPGGAKLSADDLVNIIGREGARLGVGLELR
jgi:rhodanese-related sulfurtransferase